MADGRPSIDWSRFVAPLVLGLAALGLWEGVVRAWKIPPYLLPGPILILQTQFWRRRAENTLSAICVEAGSGHAIKTMFLARNVFIGAGNADRTRVALAVGKTEILT